MKRAIPLVMLALAAAALASCEHREYTIEMSSRGEVLERGLFASIPGDPNSPAVAAEIAALTRLYQVHRYEPNAPHLFAGLFRGRTPNDIGGAGFHSYLASPLGGTTLYIERFRGNDDLVGQIETRLKAADRLVDIFSGWLKTQAGTEKDFDKLRAFLDKDLRRDLKNLSLYLWIGSNDLFRLEPPVSNAILPAYMTSHIVPGPETQPATSATYPVLRLRPSLGNPYAPPPEGSPPAGLLLATPPAGPDIESVMMKARQELVARICQYLMEKGYFQPKDASLFYRALNGSDEEKMQGLSAILSKVLAGKGGVENKALLAKVTAFSRSKTEEIAVADSLTAYLKETPEYKARLAEWKSAAGKDPNSKDWGEPDAMDVVTDALGDLAGDLGGLLGPGEQDALAIRMACTVEPVYTNGEWRREANAIVWSRSIRQAGGTSRRMSTLCYAVWAEPNEAFQKKHFGGVVLAGPELMEYCLWRGGLSPKEAAEWDALVASLAPNSQLVEKVRSFQFSAHPAPRPPQPATAGSQPAEPRDYLQRGKDMILRAMEGSTATEPATQPTAAPRVRTDRYIYVDGRWKAVAD